MGAIRLAPEELAELDRMARGGMSATRIAAKIGRSKHCVLNNWPKDVPRRAQVAARDGSNARERATAAELATQRLATESVGKFTDVPETTLAEEERERRFRRKLQRAVMQVLRSGDGWMGS